MTNSQDQYINSLKQIKEVEEKAQQEIDNHRSAVEQEIKSLEEHLKAVISESENAGKALVEKSIVIAKENAIKEAENIVGDAEEKSKTLKISSDKKTIDEIIKILLSDI